MLPTFSDVLDSECINEETALTRRDVRQTKIVPSMAWLRDDLAVPRKQRRTARKIYDDLVRDHGYAGSRSSVERLVRRIREDTAPAGDGYLELDWPAGVAQVDFGHAVAWLDGERVELHLLVMSFPHPDARFCVPPVSEAAECLCAGLRTLSGHVGGAPTELVLDNATEAGRRTCGVVRESALFSQFRAHYGCRSTYRDPYSGNEKGSVENAVGFPGRNLMAAGSDFLLSAYTWTGRGCCSRSSRTPTRGSRS